jgi:hypothetical protein
MADGADNTLALTAAWIVVTASLVAGARQLAGRNRR